jgi:UDPglucose--hexose-1-phosphate uridylyltransferase
MSCRSRTAGLPCPTDVTRSCCTARTTIRPSRPSARTGQPGWSSCGRRAPRRLAYVFVFENRGRMIGSTIDHPHSQVMAFGMIPPIPKAELSASTCQLCQDPADDLLVTRRRGWQAVVPWSPSWPYELLISPRRHVADLPTAGSRLRAGLGVMLVDALTRMDRLLGRDTPYMLWVHQRPADGGDWPAAHLHLHLAPALRAPGVARHLAAAELGAGVFFDPVDPQQAAAQWRSPCS